MKINNTNTFVVHFAPHPANNLVNIVGENTDMHQLAGFVGLSFYAKQTAVGRLALTYWISHAKWSTISSSSSSGSSSKVILEPHLCTYVSHFRAPDHELYGVSHVTGAMRSDHSEHNLQRELQLGSNVFAADFWQIYECLSTEHWLVFRCRFIENNHS